MHRKPENPRKEAGRRGFFLRRELLNPKKQWISIKHFPNHQSGHEVDRRSINRSNICKLPRSSTTNNSTNQNGTSTTENTNVDRQLSCALSCNKQYPAKNNKGNGNSFQLSEESRHTRAFQVLLEIRKKELRKILDKSSSRLVQ